MKFTKWPEPSSFQPGFSCRHSSCQGAWLCCTSSQHGLSHITPPGKCNTDATVWHTGHTVWNREPGDCRGTDVSTNLLFLVFNKESLIRAWYFVNCVATPWKYFFIVLKGRLPPWHTRSQCLFYSKLAQEGSQCGEWAEDDNLLARTSRNLVTH